MRGQRGQWAGEGYIVSILVTIIGLLYLYLNNIGSMVEDKGSMRIAVIISLMSLFFL